MFVRCSPLLVREAMAKKEELVIGIDIGTHAVKICQLQRVAKGGYRLLAAGSALLPAEAVEDGAIHEPEAVGKVVASLLKNLKIKGKKVGVSISGYSVIVKKINLEAMNDEELSKYITAEAEQYIPFDVNDVYLDFQRLPTKKPGSDRDDIMLVAAKKDVVNEYLDMLSALKLSPGLVDVDGFALSNIWSAAGGDGVNVALIDIGASKMNINIIAEGVSVLARDVVVGSEQLTNQIAVALDIEYDQAEKVKIGALAAPEYDDKIRGIFTKVCSQWVAEIKKAVDLYRSNNPKRVLQSIVLSGGGSKVAGLPDFIAQETQLSVTIFDPFIHMQVDEKKFDRQFLSAIGPEMAIATGLAIRPAIL